MKAIILAGLFALGLTLCAPSGASAAAIGNGVEKAAKENSLVDQVRCRWRRVCYRTRWGVRCHSRRYCW